MFASALTVSLILTSAPMKLGVLGVSSSQELQAISAEVTLLLETTAQKSGYDVVSANALQDQMGEDAFAGAQGCRGKPDCLARKLSGRPLARAVSGVLERDDQRYRLRLFLVQLDPPALLATSTRDIPIASRRFAHEVSEMVPQLLLGEKEPLGTLHLTSNSTEVTVDVDGVSAGTLPTTVHPKPGKHWVKASKPHHLTVERWVTVPSTGEATEDFRMLLEPGALTEEQKPGIEVAHQGSGVWLGRPWPFWLVAGGTALALGTAGGFALDSSTRLNRLRQSYNSSTQTYGEPRTEALRGEQSARMANVFFIVAGAGALASGILYVALPAGTGGKAPVAWISPSPQGTSLGLRGEF